MAGPNTVCLNAAGLRDLAAVIDTLDSAVARGGTTFAGELVLLDETGKPGVRLPVYWDDAEDQHRVGVEPGKGI